MWILYTIVTFLSNRSRDRVKLYLDIGVHVIKRFVKQRLSRNRRQSIKDFFFLRSLVGSAEKNMFVFMDCILISKLFLFIIKTYIIKHALSKLKVLTVIYI